MEDDKFKFRTKHPIIGKYLILPYGYCRKCYNPVIYVGTSEGIYREIMMPVKDKYGNYVTTSPAQAVLFNQRARQNGTYETERYERDFSGNYVLHTSSIEKAFGDKAEFKCLKCACEYKFGFDDYGNLFRCTLLSHNDAEIAKSLDEKMAEKSKV